MPLAVLRRSAILLASGLTLTSVVAPLAHAQDLIPPKTLNRRFPTGQFCALPIEIAFVATSATAKIRFEAQNYILDGSSVLQWTRQAIDNVAISAGPQYDANFGPPPAFSEAENCYIGDPTPVQYFYSNRAGLTLQLFERFDNDPTPRGWDMTHGAYFDASRTARRDVEAYTDLSGGCLGLGLESASPSLSDVPTSEVQFSGLTAGETYKVSAWWDVDFVQFDSQATYLTVRILGEGSTEIARKSWGALKKQYR